jgi:hypothetical protein
LALVGGEQLVVCEGVVVADQAVAAVEAHRLFERVVVGLQARLGFAVVVVDREREELVDVAFFELGPGFAFER